MKINIELKHIVIPFVVLISSFIILIFNFKTLLTNPSYDIGFLYTNSELYSHTSEFFIYDELNDFINSEEITDYITLETSTFSNVNIYRLKEFSNSKELVVLNNIEIDEKLVDFFEENTSTFFVLFDTTGINVELDNVISIDIDWQKISKSAANDLASTTNTHKYLYIDTDIDSDAYLTFVDEIQKKDSDAIINQYIVQDTSNNLAIRQKLTSYLDDGVDSIYVSKSIVSEIVIETATAFQLDIIEYENLKNEQELLKEENVDEEETLIDIESSEDEELVENESIDDETIVDNDEDVIYFEQSNINIVVNTFDDTKLGEYQKGDEIVSTVSNSYTFEINNIIKQIYDDLQDDRISISEYAVELK